MSQQVSGVCQEVKTKQTSIGPMYDVVVNGQSYGVGKYPPKCKAGDNVVFGVTFNGKYANMDTKSLQVTPGDGSIPAMAQAKQVSDSRGPATQEVIERQSALNSAIAMTNIIVSAMGGAKPAAIEKIMEKYRAQFYNESTGKTWPEAKAKVAPETEATPDEASEWA